MTSPRPSLDEILFKAAELEPKARGAFLDEACAGDEELRRELESLLPFLPTASGFLESPPQLTFSAGVEGAEATEPDRSGERFGAYVLTAPLGEGGMGSVYLAERADGAFEKKVAVKLIRRDLAIGDLERRFVTERQALAGLEHPSIARLLDGGTSDEGVPFLVMEYIEGGVPIDRGCREQKLSCDHRLGLFLDVCDAVQHAHGKLVVHRDIKPSNVLLDRDGRIRLLDFGIAKILGTDSIGGSARAAANADLTAAGARAMTPAYASPEQLAGEPVTTVTDVYSLGVLLHLLVRGELPSDRIPAAPTDDLGYILDKALQAKPRDRYQTADQLASDIRRYLDGYPVTAAPDSLGYRATRFYGRNRGAVITAVAVAAALVVATAVSTRSFFAAEAAREIAEIERDTAEQVSAFLEGVLGSIDPDVAQGRDVDVLADVIDKAASRIPSELADQPEVAASLHVTLGRAYERIARYEAAEEQIRRAIDIRRAAGGAPLAQVLVQFGGLLTQLNREAEAETALLEAVELTRDLDKGGSLESAAALTALGDVLNRMARTDEAERALREALESRRRGLPSDDPQLAATLDLLGWVLATTDRAAEAEPLLRESVAVRRGHGENQPLELGTSLNYLAYDLRLLGQHDEAQALYEEDVALSRRLLGEDHPNVGTKLQHLASLHQDRGNYEAAEGLYLQALEIQRLSLGEHHREVGTTLNNLGGLQRLMGRFLDAERSLGEAMRIYQEALGEQHAWVAIAFANLIQVYLEKGDCVATEQSAAEFLPLARRSWPDEHWRIAVVEGARGACLLQRGQSAEAEPVLLASYQRIQKGLGAEHPHTRTAAGRLVALFEQTGRQALAAEYRSRGSLRIPSGRR